MRTERLWWVLALIAFWGLALFGHKFWHRSYSTEKPINYDKPKVDTVTFDTLHSELKGAE